MTTGTTTSQMLNAPLNAIYVWHRANDNYPKALAKHLGRDDLEIVGPLWLSGNGWCGRRMSGVVVDHFTSLSLEQSKVLKYLQTYRIPADEEMVKQEVFAHLDGEVQEMVENAVAGLLPPQSQTLPEVWPLIRGLRSDECKS